MKIEVNFIGHQTAIVDTDVLEDEHAKVIILCPEANVEPAVVLARHATAVARYVLTGLTEYDLYNLAYLNNVAVSRLIRPTDETAFIAAGEYVRGDIDEHELAARLLAVGCHDTQAVVKCPGTGLRRQQSGDAGHFNLNRTFTGEFNT